MENLCGHFCWVETFTTFRRDLKLHRRNGQEQSLWGRKFTAWISRSRGASKMLQLPSDDGSRVASTRIAGCTRVEQLADAARRQEQLVERRVGQASGSTPARACACVGPACTCGCEGACTDLLIMEDAVRGRVGRWWFPQLPLSSFLSPVYVSYLSKLFLFPERKDRKITTKTRTIFSSYHSLR